MIDEGHLTDTHYTFTIKPNFSTLGSIIEFSRQEPLFSFLPNDSIRDLLGFNATTLSEDYNRPPNPVDILSFDNIFIERDIAHRMIFEGKQSKKLTISLLISQDMNI